MAEEAKGRGAERAREKAQEGARGSNEGARDGRERQGLKRGKPRVEVAWSGLRTFLNETNEPRRKKTQNSRILQFFIILQAERPVVFENLSLPDKITPKERGFGEPPQTN